MLCKSLTDVLTDDPHTSDRVAASQALRSTARALAALHFATARFGVEGFSTWREVFGAMAGWVAAMEAERERDSARDPGPQWEGFVGAVDLVKEFTPVYCGLIVETNAARKCRLLFHLTLSRALLPHLTEPVVAENVLPRTFPYLALRRLSPALAVSDEDRDLFEMSHALCAGVIGCGRRYRGVVKEFAGWYSGLLVENFPDPIDFDLLRRTYAFIVKALASYASTRHASVTLPSESNPEVRSDDTGDAEETEEAGEQEQDEDDRLEARLRELEHDELEGDELAWACISRLVERIVAPAPTPRNVVPGASRLEAILAAAPEVETALLRDQLAIVLFDQIRSVPARGLEPLLATVRGLMLDGVVPAEVFASAADHEGVDSDSASAAGVAPDPRPAPAAVAPLGISSDPDASPLWRELFDAVGQSRGLDVTRRERCVKWYLVLLSDARRARLEVRVGAADDGGAREAPVEVPPSGPAGLAERRLTIHVHSFLSQVSALILRLPCFPSFFFSSGAVKPTWLTQHFLHRLGLGFSTPRLASPAAAAALTLPSPHRRASKLVTANKEGVKRIELGGPPDSFVSGHHGLEGRQEER
ncbi:hypothetical protein BDK51DRAFT_39380 [Blyttiomyces helicus]|uniref:Uncharacterized protein n=1 Tax=Blyttiomyces helicus TaxID=388810 RepID=A0A4P9W157_9FUNG|nr:hypothetical protein BDK51DRAFT_39380 [Blyttiomyces helicus]|eukprot:RKO83796.1 hypothetical protein BDK51DRAFT_39380 [Blyttiomyces helicus]